MFVVVQSLSHVQLFATPWTDTGQVSLSFTISWRLPKFMSIESVIQSIISSSVVPSSCLQSFPASGFFSSESVLQIKWPKYWSFSFSISPSNAFSGLISFRIDCFDFLAFQGAHKSPPTPQFKGISSLVLSLLYGPTLTSIHDSWENHSFDYINLCWQSDVTVF